MNQWWYEIHLLPGELGKLMNPRTHSSACAINKNIRKRYITLKLEMIYHPLVHVDLSTF